MVQENSLSALLSEFARTLTTDFPIQAILDHLVLRIVDALPVTGAGVTLISPGLAPHYIAASNDDALAFERMQTELGEGPCQLAYASDQAVVTPDLRVEHRFPRFTGAALRGGLAASFTFPLRHNDGRLGALDLYRDEVGPLDESDMVAAQTLADVAAAYILNAQAREEARAASDRYREGALRDPLTGLANRRLLRQRLDRASARAGRSLTGTAVLFADLDRFKQINDTYGHDTGDELLIAVARRLAGLVRPGDTLARVSGDEFVFLCEDLTGSADVEAIATRIFEAFIAPFSVGDVSLTVGASVGMAFAAPGEAVSKRLITEADLAMYQVKRRDGARQQVVDLHAKRRYSSRSVLEQDLLAAFGRRHVSLAYQPLVRAADGRVTGVEALLRWTHPERGPIAATEVVEIAESTGLIDEIGAWTIERACAYRGRWLREHPGNPLDVAVNVSARQLLGSAFAATLADLLSSTSMDPSALTVDMTESIVVGDADRATIVLGELKALGVRVALDDFGTGYCSLNHLRSLPIDIVKIDRSLVRAMEEDAAGSAIVAAITQLGRVLDLTVVAEGVETPQQRDRIVEVGCDAAQGHHYARPMGAHEMSALLGSSGGGALHLPAGPRVPQAMRGSEPGAAAGPR